MILTRFLNKLVKGKEDAPPLPPPSAPAATLGDQARPLASFTSVDWQPGDVVDDRYRIEAVMAGSMGKVFIAEHLGWKIKMAIKSPRPEVMANSEGVRCIVNEAESWIRMGMHPNIAACYFVLAIEDIPHLFIEYVDGGNLMDWIQAGKCRDPRTSLSLAIQFCHGMEYTHANNMIHRDIKPQNILITKSALLKITDFGIVLQAGDDQSASDGQLDKTEATESTAKTIGFRGTPGYASPEQFQNSHTVDRRSDIFSFGICLWLMLCGRKPYAKNFIREAPPEPVAVMPSVQLPPPLTALLKKCVAFAPEERFQDFRELRVALNQCYEEIFRIPCPYAELGDIDLRADSLNNRAVSLFELGKVAEAEAALRQTLEINDVLPEAIYNHLLLAWQTGSTKPQRLLRQIEAARKSFPQTDFLKDLEEGVGKAANARAGSTTKPEHYPEMRLCIARKTLEIFRDSQMHAAIQRNMVDLLANKNYKACNEVLQRSWQSQHFKRDKDFTKTYEELCRHGRFDSLDGCQRLTTLKGCGARAAIVEPVPGTKKFIALGPAGEVLLRDMTAVQNIKLLKKAASPVTAVAMSPTADQLAIGCEDGGILLWSTQSRVETSIETGTTITALLFHPGGKTLVAGTSDGAVTFYLLPTFAKKVLPQRGSGAVRSMVFYNKGRNLATGSDDGAIRLCETGAKDFSRVIDAHALPVNHLSLATTTPPVLASCSADRHAKFWDLAAGGMLIREIKAHEEAITSILMLPDGRHAVTGCEDDIIRIWEVESGKCLLTLNQRGGGVTTLRSGPRDHFFLSGGENGAVILWMLIYRLDFTAA